MGDPQTIGFNHTQSWSNDLDDLGVPLVFRNRTGAHTDAYQYLPSLGIPQGHIPFWQSNIQLWNKMTIC